MFLLGAKKNPYPYMQQCDIYVQPSYTEGYCLTVCEAAILRKPIVLTAAAAAGVLEDGINAIVTEPETESIAEGIIKLAANSELRDHFELELERADFSNREEIQKLLFFLERKKNGETC